MAISAQSLFNNSKTAIKSVLFSYAQVFFSNSLWFACILLCVSFLDVWGGIAGLVAVICTNILAFSIGFNRSYIKQGYYGFNALLVGLGIGVYFAPSIEFYLVLFIAVLLTLFITVTVDGMMSKFGLPYLSIPFIVALWTVTLATRQFAHLEISQRGVFIYNELYAIGGQKFLDIYHWFGNLPVHESLLTYFRSLGAIFFQNSVFAGVMIAIGLLFYSRIAFSLSLLSFFTAYFFYSFIGADITQLSHGYVGFNFILTSIALGGFFIVASRRSYLWVIVLTPLIAVLIAAFSVIFNTYQLQIYSLPFNLIVILFLYILRYRVQGGKHLQLVVEQNYSPELNLYNQQNYSARFSKSVYIPLELPVRDEWTVTQGHDGKITHRDDWRHAWDFEIENEQKQFYHGDVYNKTNYFCYQKPVYAPGDGWVENIIDHIDDNPIGNVDLEHNWGNTIIIRHAEGLYCNLSHLKKESFKVSIGDYVKRGDVVALCGNSGRSPQPHVHFQLQSLPFVGSTTIQYPISHYIEHDRDQFKIHFFDIPAKGQRISNINPTQSVRDALKFVPGQKISYKVTDLSSNTSKTVTWEVLVDYYNNSYLYCSQTKSAAYYHTDGKMFMFTRFYGNKKSELFYFYLSLYRISLGFYPGLIIEDSLPLALVNLKPLMVLQDFLAPIVLFMHSKYEATYLKKSEDFSKSLVNIESKISFGIHRFEMRKIHFNLEFTNFGLEKIEFGIKHKKFKYQQVNIHRTINDQDEHA